MLTINIQCLQFLNKATPVFELSHYNTIFCVKIHKICQHLNLVRILLFDWKADNSLQVISCFKDRLTRKLPKKFVQ